MSGVRTAAFPQSQMMRFPTRGQRFTDGWDYAAKSYEALSEAEAYELAARLLDATTEAKFDHLLAATMTRAAEKAGGALAPELGSALGGLLKSIARHGLAGRETGQMFDLELEGVDELEYEFATNLQFVQLASEAARNAWEAGLSNRPNHAALAALAAAAEIYAPALVAWRETESEWQSGPSFMIEPFDYDPEMEYFLGGLVRSIGNVASGVARGVGAAVKSAVHGNVAGVVRGVGDVVKTAAHAVGDLSSSVADTLGKVPLIGPGLKGLYGYTYGALIQAADNVVSGVRLDKVASRYLEAQVQNIKEVAPYVQTVISLVPAIGPGISGAISAGLTLAQGRPIDEALVDAAAGALPGGVWAKSIAKMAFAVASGKPLSDIAISALPISPAAKDGLKVGLRIATDVAQGKRVDKVLLAEANRQIDRLPPQFRQATQVGVALGQGKKLQDIAIERLPRLVATGGPLAAAGQKIALQSPIVRQARSLVPSDGRHGFDVAQGLMAHTPVASHQLERTRQALRGEARKGFDAAVVWRRRWAQNPQTIAAWNRRR